MRIMLKRRAFPKNANFKNCFFFTISNKLTNPFIVLITDEKLNKMYPLFFYCVNYY